MSANPSQLFLLADHIKLSLLERSRAKSLSPSSDNSAQDASIARSLSSFLDSLESLESDVQTTPDSTLQDQASQLRKQYTELNAQFKKSGSEPASASETVSRPNDVSLAGDFAHATTAPGKGAARGRKGRDNEPYRDDPDGANGDRHGDEEAERHRNTLFGRRYQDSPSPARQQGPDPSELSNQQIHEHHSQILAEQDNQLDQLGVSIGRQRELSMRIGDELDEQVAMLEDVEDGVDRHQTRLDGARDRLGRLARKATSADWSWYIIGVLILVLVVLIVVLK